MWTNPRFEELTGRRPPGSATATAPPEPRGRALATFSRRGAGVDQELRAVLDEYEGHPYVALRIWQRDRSSGHWWPLKGKGVSIRLSEIDGLVEALECGLAMADAAPPDDDDPGS